MLKIKEYLRPNLFKGKVLRGEYGEAILCEVVYNIVLRNFINNEYIDEDDKITQNLVEDIKNNNLSIPDFLQKYKNDYINLIKGLFVQEE